MPSRSWAAQPPFFGTPGLCGAHPPHPEEIALNQQGRSSDPKRQVAVAFAKALIEKRGKVTDEEFAAVKAAGRTDADIVEMIALPAQFLLTSFMNNAVQTPIDFPEVEPVKAA